MARPSFQPNVPIGPFHPSRTCQRVTRRAPDDGRYPSWARAIPGIWQTDRRPDALGEETEAPETDPGPLAGTVVLDLTRLLPGGYCTLLLSDLGADVVKVEEPGRGDYIRWMPPLVEGESAAHRALNRGKRSITLNLKDHDGVRLLHRLAERADVLVESFRPGVMERLGVGFDPLRAAHAGIVYCAITGYGQAGPYRDR